MRRARGPSLLLFSLLLPLAAQAKVKVAAIGASTTAGSGSSDGHAYPDELQRLLGPEYEVKNFGVGGTCLLRKGRPSYWATSEMKAALAYQPDVALFWFGGNDSKAENWTPYKGEFLGDYVSMINMFQSLPTKPRTFVSVSVLMKDTGDIRKAVVDNEIGPLVRQAGAMTSSGVFDLRSQFEGMTQLFNADGIHPNDRGTAAIAGYVAPLLLKALATPDAGAPDSAAPAPDAGISHTDVLPLRLDVAAPVTPAPDASAPVVKADAAPTKPDPEEDPPAMNPTKAAKSGGCSVGGGGAGPLPLLLIALLALRRRNDLA